MKKTLSILLAIIIALSTCSLAAFAADADEEQHYYWEDDEYSVAGVLGADMVTIKSTDSLSFNCYEINASQSGVYVVSVDTLGMTSVVACGVSDYIDNRCNIYTKDYWHGYYEDDVFTKCYCIEMKENEKSYLFVDLYGEGSAEVTFDYLGAVKDFTSDTVLLSGNNMDCYYEDGGMIAEFGYLIKASFESGKSICFWAEGYSELTDEYDTKSVETTVDFLGKEFTINLSIMWMRDVIKSIELPDGFKPSYTQAYSFDDYDEEEYPEYIIINFTDGTSQKYDLFFETKVPALGDIAILPYGEYDGDYFFVRVGDYSEEFDATMNKQSASEIAKGFFSNFYSRIAYWLDWIKFDVGNALPSQGDIAEINYDLKQLFLSLYYEMAVLFGYIR